MLVNKLDIFFISFEFEFDQIRWIDYIKTERIVLEFQFTRITTFFDCASI